MKKMFLAIIMGLILCLPATGVSSNDRIQPLCIDEDLSMVKNLTTGESWKYSDFISSIDTGPFTFNANNYLRFEFMFRNEQPRANIPPSYYLHVLTDLSNPCWVYETPSESTKHCDNTWDVWNKFDDHRLYSFEITLTGTVPPPVSEEIFEPGFGEEFKISGIVRKPLRITLVLFDGKDSVQHFTENLVFHSTTQTLESMMEETEYFLRESEGLDSELNSGFENSDISFDKLRDDIRKLGEEGRPGWAKILAEDIYSTYESNKPLTPVQPDEDQEITPWGLILLLALGFAAVGLVSGYVLKRPYVPYKELDDATQMIEDIRNKVQVLGYSTEDPELQTKISDLNSKDLSFLKNKISMIEYLITRKEPVTDMGVGEGATDEI